MPTNINKSKRRINFSSLGTATPIKGVRHINVGGYGRDFKVSDIEQLQDSLLARPEFNEARRLAVLATSVGEAGHKGFASRGIGGNGMLGFGEARMPLIYVGNGPVIGGKQIHHNLEQMRGIESGTWTDGGSGGPRINTAQEGHDMFWNEKDVAKATTILNKAFIRPADKEKEWRNRAAVALYLQQFMK